MFDGMDQLHFITWAVSAVIIVWLLLVTLKLRSISIDRQKLNEKLVDSAEAADTLVNIVKEIEYLAKRQSSLANILKKHRQFIDESIRSVGLVRYDAFHDIGGEFSFSAALLDDKGDGLIITSINGRNEGRVYAKIVSEGSASSPLSEEEEEAIKKAIKTADEDENVVELEYKR